ncbi:hydroxymethylbilane synthase [Neisseria sp. Ec49-e6-T10]|uniref:hydroxymethylbilane synthase n=1 Tax=Neisseria sp. Ec49-e6-T10 TaxID=3140744 RepID=UPI003EC0DE50
MNALVIASRESQLAMWQAEHIQSRLCSLYPEKTVTILGMTTQGDQILDKTLSKIGGKGLFVKELEQALLDGRADLAVHSLKDVPMQLPEGFILAAITERENPCDAFVSNRYQQLSQLPDQAVVGTSSLRREAQIRAKFPHLVVKPLRGNVQTRLRKLDEGEYDAIILAASGLIRLGLQDRIQTILSPQESLPAAGQGALAIEIAAHRQDLLALLEPLNHEQSHACVLAERAVSRKLGGSCQVPLAAYAQLQSDHNILLQARVASIDGTVVLSAHKQGALADAEALGLSVADDLIKQGALPLIEQVLATNQ